MKCEGLVFVEGVRFLLMASSFEQGVSVLWKMSVFGVKCLQNGNVILNECCIFTHK